MLGKSVAPAVHHLGAERAMRACLRSVGTSAAAGTMQLDGLVWPSVTAALPRGPCCLLSGRQWGLGFAAPMVYVCCGWCKLPTHVEPWLDS